MSSATYELAYLEAGIELLDAYLLSDDIYWTLGMRPPAGEDAFRQLTLGGLLLNEQRLKGRDLPVEQAAERRELETSLQKAILHHRVAWERKASREYQARLKLWINYLNEYRDAPENHANRYDYEVERRVMLELLDPFARETPMAEKSLLASLDQLLRSMLVTGAFIWDADVSASFDQKIYWYLYGKPGT